MKLIVVSKSRMYSGEAELIIRLLDNGLELFHLRKPHASRKSMEIFINQIPSKYWGRIVVHSNYMLAAKYQLKGIHLTRKERKKKLKTWLIRRYLNVKHPALSISTSYHSLEPLNQNKQNYEYVFLSTIFNSVSKDKKQANFVRPNLSVFLNNSPHNVIALGGIEASRIDDVAKMGFSGAAAVGGVWASDDPLETFLEIKEQCENPGAVLV
jgi:thiamine-phosphate pyrophosphorylase